MNFKRIADVEVVEKTSKNGYTYQVVRVTFDNGKSVDLHAEPRNIMSLIYAMNF